MNEYTDKINADDFMIESVKILNSTDKLLTQHPRVDKRIFTWIYVELWFNSTIYNFDFQARILCSGSLSHDLEISEYNALKLHMLTAAVCDYYGKINNVEDDDNIAAAMQWRIEEIIKEKSGAQKLYDDYIDANYAENEAGQWVRK